MVKTFISRVYSNLHKVERNIELKLREFKSLCGNELKKKYIGRRISKKNIYDCFNNKKFSVKKNRMTLVLIHLKKFFFNKKKQYKNYNTFLYEKIKRF